MQGTGLGWNGCLVLAKLDKDDVVGFHVSAFDQYRISVCVVCPPLKESSNQIKMAKSPNIMIGGLQ